MYIAVRQSVEHSWRESQPRITPVQTVLHTVFCTHPTHDAQSIRNHDQGKKHQAIVEEFFRKKREDKLKGASSESDLKRQMDQIEKVWRRGSGASLKHRVQGDSVGALGA